MKHFTNKSEVQQRLVLLSAPDVICLCHASSVVCRLSSLVCHLINVGLADEFACELEPEKIDLCLKAHSGTILESCRA